MDQPIHEHDCTSCVFVGTDSPSEGEPRTNQVDMYFCPRSATPHGTLIRRYGSEGGNYGAMIASLPIPVRYLPVLRAARSLGLIPKPLD